MERIAIRREGGKPCPLSFGLILRLATISFVRVSMMDTSLPCVAAANRPSGETATSPPPATRSRITAITSSVVESMAVTEPSPSPLTHTSSFGPPKSTPLGRLPSWSRMTLRIRSYRTGCASVKPHAGGSSGRKRPSKPRGRQAVAQEPRRRSGGDYGRVTGVSLRLAARPRMLTSV